MITVLKTEWNKSGLKKAWYIDPAALRAKEYYFLNNNR